MFIRDTYRKTYHSDKSRNQQDDKSAAKNDFVAINERYHTITPLSPKDSVAYSVSSCFFSRTDAPSFSHISFRQLSDILSLTLSSAMRQCNNPFLSDNRT